MSKKESFIFVHIPWDSTLPLSQWTLDIGDDEINVLIKRLQQHFSSLDVKLTPEESLHRFDFTVVSLAYVYPLGNK